LERRPADVRVLIRQSHFAPARRTGGPIEFAVSIRRGLLGSNRPLRWSDLSVACARARWVSRNAASLQEYWSNAGRIEVRWAHRGPFDVEHQRRCFIRCHVVGAQDPSFSSLASIELRLAADNAVPTTSASMLHCATVQALTAKHWRRRGSGLRVKCFSCVRRHWPPAEISVTRKHLYIMRCCGRCLRLGQTSPDGPTGWPGLLQRA
jgi:hypothetical protein